MKLYRYEDVSYGILNEWEEVAGNYVKVEERNYEVIKETPCGYWIQLYSFSFDQKKWVSGNAKKRFAYPTKIEAMTSFKARKNSQIKILESQLKKAKQALDLAEGMNIESNSN